MDNRTNPPVPDHTRNGHNRHETPGQVDRPDPPANAAPIGPALALTSEQAAALFQVDVATWAAWQDLGLVPEPVNLAGILRFPRASLESWAAHGCPPRKHAAANDLLTAREAAALAGKSERNWRTMRAAGMVPEPIQVGGSLRWRRTELLAWLADGCPKPG